MQDQPIGAWLEDLASEAPAPGGGAAAALNGALGAALIEMVCNLTVGKPRYAVHEPTLTEARATARQTRVRALELAARDAAAFAAVVAAYKLPKETDQERAARQERIQLALIDAAQVPLETAGLAAAVVRLAAQILPGANVNVLSDVAVAAASAQAALRSAIVNVEVNIAAMSDPTQRDKLVRRLADHQPALAEADRIVDAVRQGIAT